jgi:HD-GYP domain-containing protein (c-di-GMP phosphodiesterase class II)
VRQAALLHDIGKIAINEEILDAPRKLTTEEFDHVKLHAVYGGEILAEIDAMRETARWIRHHHERPDGTGYPLGLLDPEIPLESKIIAVVDAYDAMTGGMEGKDGRPFRPPMTQDEALAELERCSGAQFDAAVVAAFRQEVQGYTR